MSKNNITLLQENYNWFMNHKQELCVAHPKGGFVVVWESEAIGVWKTGNDALAAAINRIGNVPFLVRSLNEEDAHHVNFSLKTTF